LLNNAIKFTEKGHVRISCRIEDNHYVLSVSDTGIGMRLEEIPKIFQPFHLHRLPRWNEKPILSVKANDFLSIVNRPS